MMKTVAIFAGLAVRTLALLLALLALPALGQNLSGSGSFNHATVGYTLDGAHVRERCETCHLQGLFRGTPRDCAGCHRSGGRAPGKTPSHVPTTTACDACHLTTSWAPSTFRHRPAQGIVTGGCALCHNGSTAHGKPANHIVTTAACDSCHRPTAWTPAGYTHALATPGSCMSCHNGVRATGRSARHIPTATSCERCHAAGSAFVPLTASAAGMHAAMTSPLAAGNCATCHNGGFAAQGAQSKPARHVATVEQCDSCHASTTTWATASFDHAALSPPATGICSSCHGTTALGKSASHVPTSLQCDLCHTGFASFKPAQMNHYAATGQCAGCHGGAYQGANARAKPVAHIPTTTQCDSCHASTTSWIPATMNHAGTAGKCIGCHSGGFLAQNAQVKPATHVATMAQCDTCHQSTTTWATRIFNHELATPAVAGRCSSCHNSVAALGKPTNHVPTAAQCDSCHTGFTGFRPARMNHAGTAAQCNACHSGAYVFANALGRPATHVPTSLQCDSCHRSGFAAWSPATMNHAGAAGTCAACHSGGYLAQNAQAKPATHVQTTAQCDTCHRSTTSWASARFDHATAVPPAAGRCSGCHNSTTALGKPTNHVPTVGQCDSCHTNTTSFAPAAMNHTATAAQCDSCHNGRFLFANARAKPATHVPTTVQCDGCHKSTSSWLGAQFVHAPSAIGTCSSCHNGATTAPGKPATHIPTGLQCDNCHGNYTAFKPATMNHAGLAGQCQTCHGGGFTAVGALAKPASHVPTNVQCDLCHSGYLAFTPSSMNHAATNAPVAAGNCSTCHGGAYIAQNAQTKSATHVATTAQCDTCHRSNTSWATATFNHATASPPVAGRCAACHTGSGALGKPPSHVPTGAQCDACHTGFIAFSPATMNHAATLAPVAAGNCATCHGGAYLSSNARAKPATHIATTASCDSCHATSAWLPTRFSHAGVAAGSCATCHNGIAARGKPASGHVPTAATCDTCHTNFTAFAPATMNHAATTSPVAAGNCATCHSGAYLAINAQVKHATHVATTAQCDTCHTSTTTWARASFTHDSTATGRCANCHNSTTALGKPTTHVPTTAQCDVCHTGYVAFRPAPMNHAATSGPVAAGNCSACHNGSYIAVNARPKPATHIPTASQCDRCHTRGYVAWAPATMNHTGLAGQCSSCHGGAYVAQNALAKPATHIVTTAQCDTCHNSTTSWATATFNHSTASPPVAGRCASCHNGTNALGKRAGHVPTTAQCDTCHKVFTAFAPATMSHAGTTGPVATGNCASCHNGAFVSSSAVGKPATHLPTTQSCDVCHTTIAWKPTSFAHTGVAPGSCASCHNGVAAVGKPAVHIPTTLACDACHRTSGWLPLTNFAHTGVAAGSCASCHSPSFANIDVKPTSHLPTTAACDACHKSFTAWLPTGTYSHAGVSTSSCQICHGGAYTNITVKPANHVPTTSPAGSVGNNCSLCHTSTTSWLTGRMNHGTMQTGCRTCHLTGTTYLGTMDKRGTSHENMGTRDCSSSGCHRPLGSRGVTYSTWD